MNAAKITVPRLRFTQPDGTPFPDWEEKCLGDVGATYSGLSGKTGNDFGFGKPFIRFLQIFQSSYITPSECGFVNIKEDENQNTVQYGDILFTISSETSADVGFASVFLSKEIGIYLNSFCFGFRPRSLEKLKPEFAQHLFRSHQYRRQVIKLAQGSTRYNIAKSSFLELTLDIPYPDEQAKIAAFLGAVDERLEGLKARHKHLTQYKRGVMQRLFSQAIRFTQPNGTPFPDWEEKRLGDVFSERNEKGFSNLQLLAVTISTGVVKTSSLSRESNTPSNKESYKRLCIGDIAYNTMRMWQGASGVSAYEGIISPAYTVIVPNGRNVSEFWGQYFKCRPVIKIFERHSQGLVSDTWSIKYPTLSSIKLFAPHPDEQTKIADFLSTIDRRINLLNQQFTTTESFKKFLLQQMFV